MSSSTPSSSSAPLSPVLEGGLTAIGCLGLLSFLAALTLFTQIAIKLFRWWHRGQIEHGPNQFLIILCNLLLADLQQSVAFILNLIWVSEQQVDSDATTCFVQGWFISVGDLASGLWIFAIALHTFYAVIQGRRLPNRVFWVIISAIWIFVYSAAVISVSMHAHLYVRAGPWCWVNSMYSQDRVLLHCMWIFIAMFGTVTVYTTISILLRSRLRLTPRNSSSGQTPLSVKSRDPETIRRAGSYMLLYPIIYSACTLPLAIARMAALNDINFSDSYYCFGGVLIASAGWLDVLLYAATRRALVFSDAPPAADDLGLDTFGPLKASPDDIGLITTITAGNASTPIRGYRRGGMPSSIHVGRRTPAKSPASARVDPFATPVAGIVVTKTTIELGPDNGGSESRTRLTAESPYTPRSIDSWGEVPTRCESGTSRWSGY